MEKDLVSVVVPIYNTEKYLRRTVESIQRQSYENIEIILVNDGSPDNVESVCKELLKDKRIQYFYQENNGVASARNLGIKKAQGKYILFCDSDDEWKENLLEKAIVEMSEEDVDFVRFGLDSQTPEVCPSDELPRKIVTQRELCVEYFLNNAIFRNMSSSCCGMYRLDLIKANSLQFREDLSHGEDGIFALEYATKCNKISLLDDNLYIYYPYFPDRITATSRTQKALYNEYQLRGMLFEIIYKKWNKSLSEEEKKKVYAAFYNTMIGRIVCFAAYITKETKRKDLETLKCVLSQEYMIEAGKYYKRLRRSDSKLIPLLMKKRVMSLLWLVLKRRGKGYIESYGKKPYVESIWKAEAMRES